MVAGTNEPGTQKEGNHMQYCEHCKVNIRDNKTSCPLCQNPLPKADDDAERIFPYIEIKYDSHLAIKISIFLSVAIIVISYVIYILFPVSINWPKYVISTIACLWIILSVVIKKRNNIPKALIWMVGILSVFSVFWDWITGFRGWSINYAMPLISVVAMLVFYITAKIMNLGPRDYLFYIMLDIFYGFVPIIFILLGWTTVLYPSIICIAVSIISLVAILLFQGDNIKNELDKRMHL